MKASKILKLLSLSGVLALLSGCELYYMPPHNQTPTHFEKGDLSFTAQGFYTGSVSASYAVTDHAFVGGSFMGFNSQNDSALSNDVFRTVTLEGGYYNFDQVANYHLEIMGGVGTGRSEDPMNNFGVDFNRFYVQPSFAFISQRRNFQNHLTFRVSHISYQDQINGPSAFGVNFFEPSYTFRAGSPYVKFHMQLGLSLATGSIESRPDDYAHDPFIFGFGINANLNVLGNSRRPAN